MSVVVGSDSGAPVEGGDGGAPVIEGAPVVADEGAVAKPDEALGEAGIKALHAERDARKAAEDRLKELDVRIREFEDRDKTEQQKLEERAQTLADELESARASIAAAEFNNHRLQVAQTKGIPAELVGRLQGDTREELEADADALLAVIGKRDEDNSRKPKPVPVLGNGNAGNLSPAEQFASLMEGRL